MQSARQCMEILISTFRDGNMLAPYHTSMRSWVQSTEFTWEKKKTDRLTLVVLRAKTDESYRSSSLALASTWPVRDSISEQGEQHPEGLRGWPLAYTHAAFTSTLPSIVPLSPCLQRMGGMGNTFQPWRPACFIIHTTREKALLKLLCFVS